MGNVVKVVSLLAVGKGDANALIGDDPIFVYLFTKVLDIDVLYTPTEVEIAVLADGDMKLSKKMSKRMDKRSSFLANFGGGKDSGRKNFMKVLAVLAKFKADLDAIGSDNMTPLHLAGQYNNSTLAKWVLERGADPNSRAYTLLRETPAMVAARFGAVTTLAALIMAGAQLSHGDVDGNTALHYAAQYGQTHSALFLLRVGMSKTEKNKEGKLAAECAIELGFHSTAQAIMGYAKPLEKVAPVMEYLIEQREVQEPISLLQGLSNAFKSAQQAARGLWNGLVAMRQRILKGLSRLFGACIGKKTAKKSSDAVDSSKQKEEVDVPATEVGSFEPLENETVEEVAKIDHV